MASAKRKRASEDIQPYISPRDLAERWRSTRSTVDRIAKRAGFTRVCLGTGKNGIVRYLREEAEAFEISRTFQA